MTECHFVIPGRDRGDVMASWAAGVSYARILNNHQRHGDVLKIATAADFCGTRWQNNAVIIPTPQGQQSRLPPARRPRDAAVSSSHRQPRDPGGRMPDGLDVVASRRGDTVYLHVANTQRTRAVTATIQIGGRRPRRTRVRDRRGSRRRGVVSEFRGCDEDRGEAADRRRRVGVSGGVGVGAGDSDRLGPACGRRLLFLARCAAAALFGSRRKNPAGFCSPVSGCWLQAIPRPRQGLGPLGRQLAIAGGGVSNHAATPGTGGEGGHVETQEISQGLAPWPLLRLSLRP